MPKEDMKEHSPNWLEISHHPCRILITGVSESGKTNALVNIINNEPAIYKSFLYAKDQYRNRSIHQYINC